MHYYARLYNEDEDAWGLVGLLHDFDYEFNTSEQTHPQEGSRLLEERGVPADVIESILSHGDHLIDTHPRRTRRDRALVAVDQLSGLCIAVALVKPSKSIFDVDVGSVKKKWKNNAFARTVNRTEVLRYTEEFGLTLDENIKHVLNALKASADILDLTGLPAGSSL
jgi:predicted hydrolase (HD superfamily)